MPIQYCTIATFRMLYYSLYCVFRYIEYYIMPNQYNTFCVDITLGYCIMPTEYCINKPSET